MGGDIFRTCTDRPWGPPSLLYNGYRVFPGDEEWPWHDADPSPPSSTVTKGQSYTSTPPMGRAACTGPQCLYNGTLYLSFTTRFNNTSITGLSPQALSVLEGVSGNVVYTLITFLMRVTQPLFV